MENSHTRDEGEGALVQRRAQVPGWAWAVVRLMRAVVLPQRWEDWLGQWLCRRLTTAQQAAVTAWIYDHEPTYLPGGEVFERGLFAWEEELLHTAPWPARGRILVGAAGGGREASWLSARGYEVWAFEPSRALVEGWRARGLERGVQLWEGSYDDLRTLADTGTGPLAGITARGYDGVLFGWGSFSYLVTSAERQATLAATRRVAPGAAVWLSFLSGELGLAARDFLPWGGFVQRIRREELEEEARRAGYEVAFAGWEPYARVLLRPRQG